jgi:hypothetical protein
LDDTGSVEDIEIWGEDGRESTDAVDDSIKAIGPKSSDSVIDEEGES